MRHYDADMLDTFLPLDPSDCNMLRHLSNEGLFATGPSRRSAKSSAQHSSG